MLLLLKSAGKHPHRQTTPPQTGKHPHRRANTPTDRQHPQTGNTPTDRQIIYYDRKMFVVVS
jgi:hypothetical protein